MFKIKATALFMSIMALCLIVIPMIALGFDDKPEAAVLQANIHSPFMPSSSGADAAEDGYAPEPEYEPEDEPEDEPGDEYYGQTLDVDNPGESGTGSADSITLSQAAGVEFFKILDETTGKVSNVPVRDFVRGAVAAEMPASFHTEALKAQAVAAHTFALHNHIIEQENPDPSLKGADFSADPSNMKVYITEATAKKFYGGGENADYYWNKICEAADSVLPYILEYDDEPIVAAYHAISSGVTEDASNLWSGSAPYLVPARSEGDMLAPGYESAVTLSSAEVRNILESAYPEIALPKDAATWFGEPDRSSSGYVVEIPVGGLALHGKEIRELFGLRSHDFTVELNSGEFTFNVTGYGHGVGLSQYGADFLARQGASFDEILANYYNGAVLRAVDVG